jgi:hypothetical protein
MGPFGSLVEAQVACGVIASPAARPAEIIVVMTGQGGGRRIHQQNGEACRGSRIAVPATGDWRVPMPPRVIGGWRSRMPPRVNGGWRSRMPPRVIGGWRARMPPRVIGGWRALAIIASVLAAAAASPAGSAAQPPPGAGGVPRFYPRIFPNDGIVAPTLGDVVTPYTTKSSGATKIGAHEIAVDFAFGTDTVAVIVHFTPAGVIDGVSSSNRSLRLYGRPLAIGFRRMAAGLRRRGWREGICTGRHGRFAALGIPDQPHTYIVWTGDHVTVAMSAAHSTFARTTADCPGISDAAT